MARETKGYVRLEWVCPKCQTRNPGPEKTCTSCGAPQPEDVQFQQAETQQLVEAPAEAAAAKAGADIHCPYCGTRNPAGTAVCVQCGGDLKGGARRQTGQVLGAFQQGQVKQTPCPSCGNPNPETATTCTRCGAPLGAARPKPVPAAPAKPNPLIWIIAVVAVVLGVAICAGLFMMATNTEASTGVVASIGWETRVEIEALRPVTHSAWKDQIPAGGELLSCRSEQRSTSNEPVAGAQRVCGTPYTVDTGSGYGEVVEDCVYQVFDDYCDYRIEEWTVVDAVELTGSDDAPSFAQPALSAGQRLGSQQARYVVVFDTPDGQRQWATDDLASFRQFQPGSRWKLNINGFGDLVSVEPAP